MGLFFVKDDSTAPTIQGYQKETLILGTTLKPKLVSSFGSDFWDLFRIWGFKGFRV